MIVRKASGIIILNKKVIREASSFVEALGR